MPSYLKFLLMMVTKLKKQSCLHN